MEELVVSRQSFVGASRIGGGDTSSRRDVDSMLVLQDGSSTQETGVGHSRGLASAQLEDLCRRFG